MASGKLTPKQTQFVAEYLLDLNATEAAKRAGYSAKTAYSMGPQLLENIGVKAAIQEAMDKRAKKLEITAESIMRDIETIKQRCLQGEPVRDKEGNPTGEWKFESHAALKACELQGRHIKMFTEKHEITGKDGEALPGQNVIINLVAKKNGIHQS